jgi:DNA-damage-inducible protein D
MSDEIKEIDNSDVVFYDPEDAEFRFPVLFGEETFWTSQKVMGNLFDVESNTVNYHLQEIFKSEELQENSVTRIFRVTAADGKKYNTKFYSLDAIIAVGYRVNSKSATKFRQWATNTLQTFIMQNLSKSKEYGELTEDQKRSAIRKEMTEHNKSLADAAKHAGVVDSKDYAIFQNEGYKGLYGGLGTKEIHEKKGLKKSQKILDFMGSTELAANLFRATQADEKLRRENIQGKAEANQAHREVGKKVRATIKELGGTMPEELPTPEKSIQQVERAERQKLNNPQ